MERTFDTPIMYNLVDEIGKGGFGSVHIASEIFSEEVVAIKILDDSKNDGVNASRFEREIKIHKMLNHNNIVPILDFNIDAKIQPLYYTMPLATKNFQQLLSDYRKENIGYMDDDTAAFYFEQILNAVEYAHSEGVLHRDLKPLNILVYDDDILKISDFGLGKFVSMDVTTLTMTRIGIGSEAYAAPEQYQLEDAKNVDYRADIYSLGKILYEILTYDLPINIDYDKVRNSKFSLIIRKATHSNKNKRYDNIKELRNHFDLLNGKKGYLAKSIMQQFSDLYSSVKRSGATSDLGKLVELLLSKDKDYDLYTSGFMKLDMGILSDIDSEYRQEFLIIIQNYLKHIDCGHTFSFTDSITDFLLSILDITDDIEIFEQVVEVILRLARNHNRFYIGMEFAKYIKNINDIDRIYTLSEILKKNKEEALWIKSYLDNEDLPELIIVACKEIEEEFVEI